MKNPLADLPTLTDMMCETGDAPATPARDVYRDEWNDIALGRPLRLPRRVEASAATSVPPADLVGLALSGGGIRSATFCLGVLQQLAHYKLLGLFDYVSSVSGGGFIGGWWFAWLARGKARPGALFPPPEEVEPARSSTPPAGSDPDRRRDPIHNVRLFSNYLTPRKGLLSPDTWRAISVVTRNLWLTWMVLWPLLACVILLFQLYLLLWPDVRDSFYHSGRFTGAWAPRVMAAAALPFVFFSWLGLTTFAWLGLQRGSSKDQAALTLIGGSVLLGILVAAFWDSMSSHVLKYAAWYAVWLLIGGLPLLFIYKRSLGQTDAHFRKEVLRNRIVRVHSAHMIALVISTAGLLIAGFGHEFVYYVFAEGGPVTRAGGWSAVLAAVASAIFSAVTKGPTGGGDRQSTAGPGRSTRAIWAIAPPLVLVILALATAFILNVVMTRIVLPRADELLVAFHLTALVGAVFCLALAWLEYRRAGRWPGRVRWLLLWAAVGLVATVLGATVFSGATVLRLAAGLLNIGVVGVVALGWTVDPNLLSLHTFYKSRLVRAYLGASNPTREHGGAISDAVQGDNLLLRDLRSAAEGVPHLIINTTLNLTAGRDLVVAQRSAASFTMTRSYCGSGYGNVGFRPTDQYMGGDVSLGAAVAISGAAASPSMGSHTPSAAMSMLLAFLNVRLGCWMATPSRPEWRAPQARFWPYYLIREFLSYTTSVGTFSYLTDGGHFDNTGVYSLVERGCRYILMVDCGADPRPTFEDLGNLARRCRIDFGAEIDIKSLTPLSAKELAERRALVVGRIRYTEAHVRALGWPDSRAASPEAREGVIVVLKPTRTKDLPVDVEQYALCNEVFPQQSTSDQWYDEAQFESYRRLGEWVAETTFAKLQTLKLQEGPTAQKIFDEILANQVLATPALALPVGAAPPAV
jgi:hypothetical protein